MAVPLRLALLFSFSSIALSFFTTAPSVPSPNAGAMLSFGRSHSAAQGRSPARSLSQVRMSSDSKLSVAVIGGGPAGLAAANTLLDVDSVGSVTVIEKSESFDDGPGTWGVGIGQRGQALMSNMTGKPWDNSIQGKTLPGLNNFCRATRPIIRRALFDALEGHPGAAGGRLRMEFGVKATAVDAVNKRVALGEDGGREVGFDLLVLADGSHSPSAEQLALPQFRTERRAYKSCLKILPLPPTPGDTKTYLLQKGDTFGWFMSLKGGVRYLIFFYPLDPATGKNPEGASTTEEVRALMAHMAGSPGGRNATFDLDEYFEAVGEDAVADFVARPPRVMWTGQRRSTVDLG
eukprot:CAMPEP_0172008374 /NCGR_PEP_ID=MMETSP1041-20130122/6618_1 /TAXON_ID=464988 /ORGANISM="Hemiselmis andersenii, Strain CCMP439" /LENGTH=347 /DNA_ID=CAMNT_0012662575 /DNA_START=74 /DNA_END=1113 /DNA_ORIENTATION=+